MNNLSIYKMIRSQIATGDLIEFAANSAVGKMIRWKTGQDVNHSTMAIWLHPMSSKDEAVYMIEPRLYIIEAVGSGFKLTFLSETIKYYDGKVNWSRLKTYDKSVRLAIADAAFELEGRPYDFPSLFMNLLRRVKLNADKPYCSEAVQLSLIKAGWLRADYSPTGKPKDAGTGIRPGEFERTGLFEEPKWIL